MTRTVLIGVTMGDPAGVGPELCLNVLSRYRRGNIVPVVFGSASLLRRVAGHCGLRADFPAMSHADWIRERGPKGPVVVDCTDLDAAGVRPGTISAACGRAAADCIRAAVESALLRRVHAVVTAPIHKESFRRAGMPWPGHTEMLASLTGTREVCMAMHSDKITVGLVTVHVSLSRVPSMITARRIRSTVNLIADFMRRLGRRTPHITVCGLNPHAGEHGSFGREERIILSALKRAAKTGASVEGPLPPDTAFIEAVRRRTDAYVVMYHDQGLIPFKMLSFEDGVNVTLGLPIVRTSVDHGTAFDIAWKNKASAGSMNAAMELAGKLAQGKGRK